MGAAHSIYPEFNYSFSRLKVLSECQRKYYYNYYLYHNGWHINAESRRKLVYRLKCLQNIDAVVGTSIHTAIRKLIVNESRFQEPLDIQKSISKDVRYIYQSSMQNYERFLSTPNKNSMLFEVYYNKDISKYKKEQVNDKVIKCSKNTFESEVISRIRNSKYEILEADELRKFNFMGRYNCYLKIDLLYRNQESQYTIWDWKTGNNYDNEHAWQLRLYAFYVVNAYNIPIESISCNLLYLPQNRVLSYTFDTDDLNMIEKRLNSDYMKISKFIKTGTANTPLEEINFLRSIDSKQCVYCNYKEICL